MNDCNHGLFFENKVKTRLAIIKMETLPKPSVLIVWYYTAPFLFRFGFAFLPKDRSHLKDGAVLKIRGGKKAEAACAILKRILKLDSFL